MNEYKLFHGALTKHLIRCVCLFLSAFLFLSLIIPVSAAEMSEPKVVRIAYHDDNASFQDGYSDDARKSGYAYDYYQEIAKYAGWRYEYVYGSWGDLYEMLLDGSVDIMAGVSRTEDREDLMLFPDNHMGVESYYIYVKSDYKGIDSRYMGTLNGKRIGVNANSLMLTLFEEYTEKNSLDCQIVTFPGAQESTEALNAGEIDGFIITDNFDTPGVKPILKVGSSDYYFAVNKRRPDLLQDINAAQNMIISSSPYYMSGLQQKYFTRGALNQALTEEETEYLEEKSVLRMGYIADCMPISGQRSDGKPDGVASEIFAGIENSLPIPVRSVCYPNVDAMEAGLLAGEIDAAFPVYSDIWFSESNGFYQTSSIVSDRVMVIYRGDYREDLFEKVAISRHSIGQRFYLTTYYPDAEILNCDSRKEYFDAVLNGTVNCSIGSSSILNRYIAEHPEYSDLNVAFLDKSEEFGIVTNSDDAKLCGIIDKAVAQIDTAKITNAMIRHSNVEQAFKLKDFLRRYVVWFIGILCLFIAGLIWMFISYRMRTIRHQREMQERFKIISSLSRIYFCSYYIDVRDNSYTELTSLDYLRAYLDQGGSTDKGFKIWVENSVVQDQQEKVLRFVDLSDISLRMKETDSISIEYNTHRMGWCQGNFIVVDRDGNGNILHVIWAVRDINEEKENQCRTQSVLESALESANAANKAKTTFLSNMSHDIRTPMNGIIGMTAIAASHIDDPERVADCLGKITTSGKHLLALINEVLDMSKIESGEIYLNDEEFEITEIIDDLITINKPLADTKRHEIDVHIYDLDHEMVIGDKLRLQQVFTNLFNNAIKYTPDGGKIEISFREMPAKNPKMGLYEFSVRDNGVGMSADYLPHVFEVFSREDNTPKNTSQGTGLGLAITRNIVRMMDGDITVESKLGEGSVFTATMFLKLPDKRDVKYEDFIDLDILVVDDDEITCESVKITLEKLGMRCDTVTSGREAVRMIREKTKTANGYFAVLLDWKMPDMDGIETSRAIRGEFGNDLPIIIISVYDWSDIEEKAIAAGVNEFVGKPLFKSKLVTLFDRLLGSDDEKQEESLNEMTDKSDYTGKRALLAEDNKLNAEIAMEILGMTGLEVEWAKNGREVVEMFESSEPGYYDCIFMDIQMPVMNGMEAVKVIRKLSRSDAAMIPIFAMTANAFDDDKQAAIAAGMNEHIAKPIDMSVIFKVLNEYLK